MDCCSLASYSLIHLKGPLQRLQLFHHQFNQCINAAAVMTITNGCYSVAVYNYSDSKPPLHISELDSNSNNNAISQTNLASLNDLVQRVLTLSLNSPSSLSNTNTSGSKVKPQLAGTRLFA